MGNSGGHESTLIEHNKHCIQSDWKTMKVPFGKHHDKYAFPKK